MLWLAVKILSVKTEFFEPFDRYEAQLVAEDSLTAEVQNWPISGIELDCVSANRTWVQVTEDNLGVNRGFPATRKQVSYAPDCIPVVHVVIAPLYIKCIACV